MALVARVTRSSMLEVFREDYIRTARSKGLRERAVIIRHALKNAFLPILTISGWQVGRPDRRNSGHRDDFPGARDGSSAGGQHPAPGLHDDPEHRDGDCLHGAGAELWSSTCFTPGWIRASATSNFGTPHPPTTDRKPPEREREHGPAKPTGVLAPDRTGRRRDAAQARTVWENIVNFAQRKPLGAFGAVVVILLVVIAIFAPIVAYGRPQGNQCRLPVQSRRMRTRGWAGTRSGVMYTAGWSTARGFLWSWACSACFSG